jgi:uncharacterized protein (DUF2236 family)
MKSAFVPFQRDSLMWQINRERLVLLGGGAAAVLQVAHPKVARGVAAHSSFRADSSGRLRRTLDAVYTVAFGPSAAVEAVRASVARAHAVVRGAGYSAFDPDAQLWVMATLIMGSVTNYERFVTVLTAAERDLFLSENMRFADVFGLESDHMPKSWDAFQDYWNAMLHGDVLGSDPVCAEVANAVIRPDAPLMMRWLAPVFRALTLEYLPSPLAQRLHLSPSKLQKPLWSTLDQFLPRLLRIMPPSMRYAPQYLAALKRPAG